jgi:hypothetical protein
MKALSDCGINGVSALKVEVYAGVGGPAVAADVGFSMNGQPFGNVRVESVQEGSERIATLSEQLIEAIEEHVASLAGSAKEEFLAEGPPQGILNKDV